MNYLKVLESSVVKCPALTSAVQKAMVKDILKRLLLIKSLNRPRFLLIATEKVIECEL